MSCLSTASSVVGICLIVCSVFSTSIYLSSLANPLTWTGIREYDILGGLDNRHASSLSGGWKCKTKVPPVLASGRPLLPDCKWPPRCYVLTWSFLCVCDEREVFGVHSSSYKDTGPIRFRLTLTTSAAAAKSHQSCPTLCNPIDGSPPGSPVPGLLQARTQLHLTLNAFLKALPQNRVTLGFKVSI